MSQSYTALRVSDEGAIPLFEGHVRRLGESCRSALDEFGKQAMPGVYRVFWDGEKLAAEVRAPSRLADGMPTRFVVSPFAHLQGRFPKPRPPSAYDSVRLDGISSLLTDVQGTQIYESCVASVIAWGGQMLVLPPFEAPGVESVAATEIAARFRHRRAPLPVDSDWPLLLINAVGGTCAPLLAGRAAFPINERAEIQAALTSARRTV